MRRPAHLPPWWTLGPLLLPNIHRLSRCILRSPGPASRHPGLVCTHGIQPSCDQAGAAPAPFDASSRHSAPCLHRRRLLGMQSASPQACVSALASEHTKCRIMGVHKVFLIHAVPLRHGACIASKSGPLKGSFSSPCYLHQPGLAFSLSAGRSRPPLRQSGASAAQQSKRPARKQRIAQAMTAASSLSGYLLSASGRHALLVSSSCSSLQLV